MISPIIQGTDTAISSTVSTIIQAAWDKLLLLYKEYMVPVPEHFIQYTTDSYDRFSKTKCLAKGQTVLPLKQIYVPLTLMSVNDCNGQEYLVDHYDADFFSINHQILIVDTAGMGKSTLVKRLYIDIIDSGYGIPIFIELRRLSNSHTIVSEIRHQVSGFLKEFDERLLLDFIREGEFIFILDGYDEIALAEKDEITNALQDFISRAAKNRFIITSRQELALASFTGFETFRIKPLSKTEAFSLLRKYDDDNQDISSLLIEKLNVTSDFDDFLGNPLLASMLLTAFSFKNEIPRQKHIFYRTVFDAYFNSHDLTKGGAYQHEKHSGLVIEDFHKVLRFIGILCLKKDKIEFTKDELIETIERALNLCPEIHCSSGDFFLDIIEVVPLFVKDGHYYRWAHKSLYEYFTAQNIYRDISDKKKALLALSSEGRVEKAYNLLDLYYEIDYTSFRNIIIKHLFQEIVSFVEKDQDLSPESIRWRQRFFFCNEYLLVQSSTPAKNENEKGKVSSMVFDETNYSIMRFNCDVKNEFFIYRNAEETGRDFLLELLYTKNHPTVHQLERKAIVSIQGLKKDYVYRLTERDRDSFDDFNRNQILQLINSMDHQIEYETARQELTLIEKSEREANDFANELFS